jgi:hypothetical protein
LADAREWVGRVEPGDRHVMDDGHATPARVGRVDQGERVQYDDLTAVGGRDELAGAGDPAVAVTVARQAARDQIG